MPLIPETWLDSQTVNTTLTNLQFQPDIAQLTNGNILVTWTSSHVTGDGAPAGTEVFGQLYDPLGTPIGSEFRINQASTVDNERDSDIVALPDGGFLVIYHDDNLAGTGGSNIRLERFDATGAGVAENPLVVIDSGSEAVPNYANPRGAASSATSVMVVYDRIEAAVTGVYFRIYDPSTNTYGAETALMTSERSRNADIAVLSNGNYVIACERIEQTPPFDNAITYRIMTATGTSVLTTSFVVGTISNGFDDSDVSVTALTGGGFVIAYTNIDASDTDINYRVYNAAGAQTGSGLITNASDTNSNNEPVVTGLADGSFIIAYDNVEANMGTVAHISAAGAQLGEFQFTGEVAQLAITSLADGRFAVTYMNDLDIRMEILDTRDTANIGVYTPNSQSIGTVGDDVFTANAALNYGYDGNDTITDGGGFNSIFGGAGNDTITIIAVDTGEGVDGGSGTNTLIGTSMSNGIIYNLALGTVTDVIFFQQALNFQHVTGSGADESFIGTAGNNILSGGAGNDLINGGAGIDTLIGGIGNDTFFVNTLGDLILDAAGQGTFDRVMAAVTYVLAAGVEVERMTTDAVGGLNAINLTGNALSQVIIGNAAGNTLSGGAAGGADTLNGQAGNDIYRVFNAGDTIIETAGNGTADRVNTNVSFNLAGNDNVEILSTQSSAGLSAINLRGNALNQALFGNAGANRLNGGGGSDTLTGALGADVFLFTTGLGATNIDIITDYNVAADRIEIDNAVFLGLAPGALAAGAFTTNATGTATLGTHRIIYETDTGFLWFDADGAGGTAARQFADLASGLAMVTGEFTVV